MPTQQRNRSQGDGGENVDKPNLILQALNESIALRAQQVRIDARMESFKAMVLRIPTTDEVEKK